MLANSKGARYTLAPYSDGAWAMNEKPAGLSLVLVSVGTVLTSMVVAGFLLGYATDKWLDSQPVFMLSFGVLGFVGGLLKVYRLLSRIG